MFVELCMGLVVGNECVLYKKVALMGKGYANVTNMPVKCSRGQGLHV